MGNAQDGVLIFQCQTNTVFGNSIAGNLTNGVEIRGAAATGNSIKGNKIGINPVDGSPMGNGLDGVFVSGPAATDMNHTVISSNVISANGTKATATVNSGDSNVMSFDTITGGNGIEIAGNANGVDVFGNMIGTNSAGASTNRSGDPLGADELGNRICGVFVDSSTGILIGGDGAKKNVISGNGTLRVFSGLALIPVGDGVYIKNSSQVTLEGNSIGTNSDGTVALPNNRGVVLDNASNDSIGVMTPTPLGNVISGNLQSGIAILNGSTGNHVDENFIGTEADGEHYLKNGESGVTIDHSVKNSIGPPSDTSFDNIISGNRNNGVTLQNLSNFNEIVNNLIGTDISGESYLRNGGVGSSGFGILIDHSDGNDIGSTASGSGNVISGNLGFGIGIQNQSDSNNIARNIIGLGKDNSTYVVNLDGGVQILGFCQFNSIGLGNGPGNTISGNIDFGVQLIGTLLSGQPTMNFIEGNTIGSKPNGKLSLGNQLDGVLLSDADQTTIDGNKITYNGRNGIRCEGILGPVKNTITHNVISNNIAAGVDIGSALQSAVIGPGNEITFNDVGVLVEGISGVVTITRDQAYKNNLDFNESPSPIFSPIVVWTGSVHIEGTLNGAPGTA